MKFFLYNFDGDYMKKFIGICILFLSLTFIINNSYKEEVDVEQRGIFISYIELNKYVKDKSVVEGKENIDQMITNIKNLGFNLVILQIRSFSDAIYQSSIFPWSSTVSVREDVYPGYDVLDYFIDKCSENNILIYGWINPYRVRTSNDTSGISSGNPAYKYLNSRHIIIDNGIYYNPSSSEAVNLIVGGVEEVVSKYKVDGILFDDYFYPNTDCDYVEYQEYLTKNDYISFDDYHLMIINNMIERVHEVCSKYNVLFGVSPDANIENNYTKLFADIKTWLSSDKYVDFIMPQVYYGFFNETKPFKKVIDEWESMITNDDISLMVALAFYKNGVEDKWAKSGSLEWVNNSNIIMREIILSRNLNYYEGFSLFRYDYIFNSSLHSKNTFLEIENMKKVLK